MLSGFPFCVERLLSRHGTTKCAVANVYWPRIILCYRLIDSSNIDRWPNNAGRMTRQRTRMTRRSSPPSRGQADRVGPAVHRRNGVPPSIQARTDRHRACRGLHRGALLAEAIMRCAQATVYDNSGSKGPRIVAAMTEGFRRRLPRLAGLDTGAASRALADAIDRRSSNTKADTGEGADDDAKNPVRPSTLR